MSRRRGPRRAAVAFVALAIAGVAAGAAVAAFGTTSVSAGNVFSQAPDWVAPVTGASVVAKAEGGTPGYIRQGGAFHVYAAVTDTGNPPSGVAAVTAAPGAVPLVPGAYSVGGVAYGHRSATLTAAAVVPEGPRGYSVTAADGAGNRATRTGLGYVVDNTAPKGTDVQAMNKTGGTAGRMEIGDRLVLTFSEPVEPISVLPGWSGASTPVVVRIDDHLLTGDVLTVHDAANAAQLPLGSVSLGQPGYVLGDRSFGASGTASTMVVSGSTITITLGTPSGSTLTALLPGTARWTPAAAATDRAGNPMGTSAVTESGSADREF